MFYYNYYKLLAKTYAKQLLRRGTTDLNKNHNYLDLGIINPSIGTSNLGDLIIYDAVIHELRSLYPDDLFTNYPSQLHTTFDAQKLMSEKDLLFVSGTNLLSSNMDKQFQWKIGPSHKIFLEKKVLLMGVGWWQYQSKPNRYTIDLYKRIFNDRYLHSVRDSYTLSMLQDIGISNVVNTTCPTLWGITTSSCERISLVKARNVVTTLTFYKADPLLDKRMLQILVENYEVVYLWVQGIEDVSYLKSIYPDFAKIRLVSPSVEAFSKILEDPSVEYLGTRLHAGVRAIQKGLRTLIVAVDNRAVEIGRDTNLNVIKRENIEEMLNFIDLPYRTNVILPEKKIQEWKGSLPHKSVLSASELN